MARISEQNFYVDLERELGMIGAVMTIGRVEDGGRSVTLSADLAVASGDGPTLIEAVNDAFDQLRAKLARHYARPEPTLDLDKLIEPEPIRPELKALDLAKADPDVLAAMAECFSFGPGYMGDPTAWCYWSYDYPDEGSVGPFASEAAALDHAQATLASGTNALHTLEGFGDSGVRP